MNIQDDECDKPLLSVWASTADGFQNPEEDALCKQNRLAALPPARRTQLSLRNRTKEYFVERQGKRAHRIPKQRFPTLRYQSLVRALFLCSKKLSIEISEW